MPKVLRGMRDLLPQDLGRWQILEIRSKEILERFGYREIRTPILEEKSLFVKSIGEETDIVTKEMFSFKDRGERDIVLRPEGTAPIVRAYLEANLHKTDPFQKFYYIGPMFRAERPQAGRMRQFYQIGAEAIGSMSPEVDAEVIILLAVILEAAKIKNYKIRLNNLGCRDDKITLSKTLRKLLVDKKALLCTDCKNRLDVNPLRLLDCKNESCRNIVRSTFKSINFLCEKCIAHFHDALTYLDALKIKYMLDPYIVRGLDYYTRTVFEVSHEGLGAQDAIGAGGRYDNLVSDMGGPELGAAGFALGVERIFLASAKQEPTIYQWKKGEERHIVYIATMGDEARRKGFELINRLRNQDEEKFIFDMAYKDKSLKAQMREADRLRARFVFIIGSDEISKGGITLRDMETKSQGFVNFNEALKKLKERLE